MSDHKQSKRAIGRLATLIAIVVALSHELFPKRHWGTMAESETFAHLEHMVLGGEAERWRERERLLYRAT